MVKEQQSTIACAGIPLFGVTDDSEKIRVQMAIIAFIRSLSGVYKNVSSNNNNDDRNDNSLLPDGNGGTALKITTGADITWWIERFSDRTRTLSILHTLKNCCHFYIWLIAIAYSYQMDVILCDYLVFWNLLTHELHFWHSKPSLKESYGLLYEVFEKISCQSWRMGVTIHSNLRLGHTFIRMY